MQREATESFRILRTASEFSVRAHDYEISATIDSADINLSSALPPLLFNIDGLLQAASICRRIP